MPFRELTAANTNRCAKIFHPIEAWSPSDWSNAMAGECGEVCNLTKKLLRGEDVSSEVIGEEIADVVIYADLLATRLGLNLSRIVKSKFNKISDRIGSSIKL